MTIDPMSTDETKEEREIRVWFSSRARDPDFLKEMAALANDLLRVRKALAGGAKARADKQSVILWNGRDKTVISRERWTYFADRGYVTRTDPPQVSPGGARMLKLYAYLINQAREATLDGAPTL